MNNLKRLNNKFVLYPLLWYSPTHNFSDFAIIFIRVLEALEQKKHKTS